MNGSTGYAHVSEPNLRAVPPCQPLPQASVRRTTNVGYSRELRPRVLCQRMKVETIDCSNGKADNREHESCGTDSEELIPHHKVGVRSNIGMCDRLLDDWVIHNGENCRMDLEFFHH